MLRSNKATALGSKAGAPLTVTMAHKGNEAGMMQTPVGPRQDTFSRWSFLGRLTNRNKHRLVMQADSGKGDVKPVEALDEDENRKVDPNEESVEEDEFVQELKEECRQEIEAEKKQKENYWEEQLNQVEKGNLDDSVPQPGSPKGDSPIELDAQPLDPEAAQKK